MAYNLKNTQVEIKEVAPQLSFFQRIVVKLFKIKPKPAGYDCFITTQIKEEENLRLNASVFLKKEDGIIIKKNFKIANALGEIDKSYIIINYSLLSFDDVIKLNTVKQLIVTSL